MTKKKQNKEKNLKNRGNEKKRRDTCCFYLKRLKDKETQTKLKRLI